MNDREARELVERYAVSWYVDVDRIDAAKVYRGDKPPVLTGAALAEAMQENVDEAIGHLDGIRARYQRAERDGLFDVDALKASGKAMRETWLEAIEVQQGDKTRAAVELAHWREYHAWALQAARSSTEAAGGGSLSTQGVADRRLPPEREPGSDDGEPSAYAGAARW